MTRNATHASSLTSAFIGARPAILPNGVLLAVRPPTDTAALTSLPGRESNPRKTPPGYLITGQGAVGRAVAHGDPVSRTGRVPGDQDGE